MSAPVLSVIVPTYDSERYVAEAIGSARCQTLRELEIIVVDDGSTDGSAEVVRRHLVDRRVRYVRQPNQGIAAARNTGLALARGEFVAFLDADDRWLPAKAERHVAHLRAEPSLDASFSWYAVIDAQGNDTGRRGRSRAGSFTLRELLRENFVWNGQPVMRRVAMERAGRFDGTLPSHEDFEYVLRLGALRERCVACIPEVLAEYRRRPGQLTADWGAMHEGWARTMQRMRSIAPDLVNRVEREAAARHYRFLGYVAWEAGQYALARRFLRRAWRTHPLALARDRRAWITTAAAIGALLPPAARESLRRRAELLRARRAAPLRAGAGAS
jgi:glycosyltransferase involved in cell wall biosynthesis